VEQPENMLHYGHEKRWQQSSAGQRLSRRRQQRKSYPYVGTLSFSFFIFRTNCQ
jgi:hypothetical protein